MFSLIWINLTRSKGRLALTLLSVLIAFLLFGVLMAARYGWSFHSDQSGAAARRLVTVNKVAPFSSLPVAYAKRIAGIPGVKAVSYAASLFGWYQHRPKFVLALAVPPKALFQTNPELVVSPAQRKAWLKDRTGALVRPATAKRFGWKVGDKVPIKSNLKQRDGGTTWYFTIDGLVHERNQQSSGGIGRIIIHYKYLDEGRASGTGTVASYTELVADADQTGRVSQAIDRMFANSAPQTRTATQNALIHSIYAQAGDIAGIMLDVAGAVFFSMLLVIGAIMLHTARERRSEYAVLRALGFRNRVVAGIVAGESILTCLIGGLIGLGLAKLLVSTLQDPLSQYLPGLALTGGTVLIGVGLMIGFGVLVSLLPAWQVSRLSVRDALGRV